MSQVVLDTSVIVAWLMVDEPAHRAALALQADVIDGSLVPILATSARFELRSAMVRAARRLRVSWEVAQALIAAVDLMALPVSRYRPVDSTLLAICRRYGVGWGDAMQMALADRLAAPLITADDRLVRTLHGSAVWVESIMERPPSPA